MEIIMSCLMAWVVFFKQIHQSHWRTLLEPYAARQEKPGMHLPANHVKIQAVRDYVAMTGKSGEYDDKLFGNFDQVWTCNFQPAKTRLWRDPSTQRPDTMQDFCMSIYMFVLLYVHKYVQVGHHGGF